MKKCFAGIAAIIIAFVTSVASAATLVSVQLVNVADSVPYSGVYAGQYTLAVSDGISPPISILAVCDDFNTHISIGQTWQAWLTTPAEVAGGTGKFAAQGRYEEAGWIFGQMGSMTPYQRARAQAAIWNLNGANPTLDALATSYRDQAIDGTHNTAATLPWLLVPDPLSAAQEFLVKASDAVQITAVPLPAAAWLLGTGFIGLVGIARPQRM